MLLDDLNRRVTAAIWVAEHEQPGTCEAQAAYAVVADLEEEIAKLTSPNVLPGQVSRVGAVRAALMSGNLFRAMQLVERYRAEGTGDALREQLDEFWERANELLDPSGIRSYDRAPDSR